ncbi:hypothetical protein NQZ79_g4190 [Umbelopsis isabellina]|nr:hypothetical protein NQZ79_g4190 [Umbelopsis isabellina]
MVRIFKRRWHEAYEKIKQDSLDGNCIVFVASDVDALCACKILQTLLKTDFIPHKIVPVSSYSDLKEANTELVQTDDELRSIVMINCGGMVDASLYIDTPANVTMYIIDSHRPLNLDNLFSGTQVAVFDDDEDDENAKELMDAYENVAYGSSDEDSDSSSDESDEENNEQEDDDTDDGEERSRLESDRPRQRRRLNEGETSEAKRSKARHSRMKIAQYYSSGMYYSQSVAGIMYTLANQLDRTTNDLLWFAITGVTSQYITEHIDTPIYLDQLRIFMDEVARFNIPQETSSQTINTSIKFEDEYRFMLYRHWSLYDSMFHSGYVASKLGVWKEFGKKRLNNMFAKMGFSLNQCQQVFTHMDIELKKILRSKIDSVAPLYGLTDICFPSFSRSYGWRGQTSASDAVYSLSSLLETSPEVAHRLGETVEWNTDSEPVTNDDDGPETPKPKPIPNRWWLQNFYTAYDALDSIEGMQRGLGLCMKLQRAIVQQGTAMIEKKSVKTLRTFRLAIIKDGPDISLFTHPLTLSKLALFLVDAYREYGKRNLPFVIGTLNESQGSYLVVGVTGAPTFGDVRQNHFGSAFQDAVRRTKAHVKHDSFETSVMEIRQDDLENFIENLHLSA